VHEKGTPFRGGEKNLATGNLHLYPVGGEKEEGMREEREQEEGGHNIYKNQAKRLLSLRAKSRSIRSKKSFKLGEGGRKEWGGGSGSEGLHFRGKKGENFLV